MHFPLSSNQNGKVCFSVVSNENRYSLLRFCVILVDIKILISLRFLDIINFIFILSGKVELSMASCH